MYLQRAQSHHPSLTPVPQEIQAVGDAPGALLGVKGWVALLELSSSVPVSCSQNSSLWGALLKAGIQSGMSPLQSKQCV